MGKNKKHLSLAFQVVIGNLVPMIILAVIVAVSITSLLNKTIFNTGSVGLPIEIDNTDEDIDSSHFSTISSYIILEGFYESKKNSYENVHWLYGNET